MRAALSLILLFAVSASAATFNRNAPSTTNNDDSCDISSQPAATLLLPYFEVRLTGGPRKTTLFTITNVVHQPQIARVTLWTDLAYPVLNFNIFLTGYDVQAIDLYDVLARGVIANTSSHTTPGSRSLDNDANPRFLPGAAAACATLPNVIPADLLRQVQEVLTVGRTAACGNQRVGLVHETAIGYATIDVVATCAPTMPTQAAYYAQELLFDNVLIGERVEVAGSSLVASSMVHIRAVPEGGNAGTVVTTNLPYTFYDRLTGAITPPVARTIDRRQPLPSAFAARYVQFPPYHTNFTIWREAVTGDTACGYASNGAAGTSMRIIETVRFDEHENPTTLAGGVSGFPPALPTVVLPATSTTAASAGIFPPMSAAAGDVGGWFYLNLSNGGSTAYSVSSDGIASTQPPAPRVFTGPQTPVITGVRQSQNWATVTMVANGQYAGTYDAIAFANGCSPAAATTGQHFPIAPGPNITP